jgi:NADPH2:quinone reductase
VKRVQIDQFGPPSVLEVVDVPDPRPTTDGYVVEVHAAGVNFADTVERRGRYRRDQALPMLLGKEAAGVVVEAGPSATEFAVGDRVIVMKFANGCYAERVAADAHEVLRPPEGFSFHEMAAFAACWATAWFAMHEIARVRPGEAVLVPAAAGGVGTAAVALAASHGCSLVIGGVGDAEKGAIALGMGADAFVDYRHHDLVEAVRELTAGRGVDYCLESVGGEVYDASLELLAPMGRLVIIGFSSIAEDHADRVRRLHPLTVFHRSISVGGLNIDNLSFQRYRDVWDSLVEHVERHRLRPRVGLSVPLTEVSAAHAAIEGRRTTGKVVLSVVPERHSPVVDLREPLDAIAPR